MFFVIGTVITARIESNDEREWGKVVLADEDLRDTVIITGSKQFAEDMAAKKDQTVEIPVKVEVSRYGNELRVKYHRDWEDRQKARAKRDQAASAPASEGAPGDGDAPPPEEPKGRRR